ncbi:hypothetical protein [Actinomycetospora lemnae]|uniref:Uncharacterized protein n=1 Tax=Actinomycetospora lemnae TaxID=3019891 RepID=A0ABT5SYL7_9PSEU|nr:hypothetical protein [Actinomycetospora sp. DW7H6]MDD7967806.1 hypothetical protein [Actinomycetospora sp. DW7H6]
MGELALAWSRDALKIVERPAADGEVELVVLGIRQIPPLVPLLFSEAIHHLRSSIENALFFAVERSRGGALPEEQARRVSFPIADDAKSFRRWQTENGRKGIPELGLGSVLAARIEGLQPYQDSARIGSISRRFAVLTGLEPDNAAPMTLLQHYSNTDKHRTVLTAAARTSIQRSDLAFSTSEKGMKPIERGQVLVKISQQERLIVDTVTAAMVARPQGTWVAPVRELDLLRRHVADIVIPTLLLGVPLAKGLPPDIDLTDTGQADRERIEAGGWTSAAERAVEAGLPAFLDAISSDPTSAPTQDDEVAD